MKTRTVSFVILLALAATFAPGIASGATGDLPPDEFTIVFGAAAPEIDPHKSIYSSEAQLFTAVYEGLFSYDPSSLEPEKAAVSDWSRSADGKTYTFHIRPEARWSDGTPLLAAHFRDAWIRILRMNAEYAAFFDIIEGAADFRLGRSHDARTVAVAAKDDRTLEVGLARPAPYFTRMLCHHSFAPIHPSMMDADDWNAAIPFPVNGPYRFTRTEADSLHLEKNPLYWDAASVAIPKIHAVLTDDDALASAMFDGGQADWLYGPGDLDVLLSQDAVQVNPMFSTHYWFFDSGTQPWKDQRIRRALALLLPWDQLRSEESYMAPASTLVLPLPGYTEARGIESADPAEARRLLEAAGFPDGNGLPPLRIAYVDGKDNQRVTGIMRKAWETLPGLKVELLQIPPSQYYSRIALGPTAGGFTLAHTTWIGDFADPIAFLQMWKSDSSFNEAGYSDPEFDARLEASSGKEGKERFSTLAQAESLLLASGTVLPMYHSFAVSVIDTGYVEGWYQNALDLHPFKYFRFGQRSARPGVASLRSAR